MRPFYPKKVSLLAIPSHLFTFSKQEKVQPLERSVIHLQERKKMQGCSNDRRVG
jgi:hypothetical protein